MTQQEIDALYEQYKRDIVEYWESEANLSDPAATDKHALARAIERERERCASLIESIEVGVPMVQRVTTDYFAVEMERLKTFAARKIRGEE